MNVDKMLLCLRENGKRCDNSLNIILQSILFNNRLKMYEIYLQYAIEQGYRVCSMKEYYDDKDRKSFVLRHDVDSVTKGIKKLYELEKKCGVTSTYYFRFSTIDLPLIKDMLKNGFEVGIHYETISDYAEEKELNSIGIGDIRAIKDRLKKEIIRFEEIIEHKTYSCASHGSPTNAKLGISNNILFEDESPESYGVQFEAYDKEMYEKWIDCHIMDTNIRGNYGFTYKDNPLEAMQHKKQHIIFLAHPEHWYFEPKRRVRNIIALCLGKVTFHPEAKFKRIAHNLK